MALEETLEDMHIHDPQSADSGENPVLFEAFEWYLPSDHKHWQRLRLALPALKDIGIDYLWLPPGSKAKDLESNGYDIYDAYDLGEFDQKGGVPTKFGTKKDLTDLADEATRMKMGLIWDAIFNHRGFADSTEKVKVVEVDPQARTTPITDPFYIEAWTKFDFEARKGKYSTFKYNKDHFNGTDWNELTHKRSIYQFVENGKHWAYDVGKLFGNADYLMLQNLDYTSEALVKETNDWGKWITKDLNLTGFRLDAVQHFSYHFADKWCKDLQKSAGKNMFFVGEFWNGDVKVLTKWLNNMSPFFRLFDVPLMYNLARVSSFESPDLREVFKNTLVSARPSNAVTFIRVHDTQPGQAMDTPINEAFMAHAYSLILLRKDGYPCVFFGDIYGFQLPKPEDPACRGKLPDLVLARKLYSFGPQTDYFDGADCIGWVRHGTTENPDGMAVVLSWSPEVPEVSDDEDELPRMRMKVGAPGEIWTDILGWDNSAVVIDESGVGTFTTNWNRMSVFVNRDARGRERFPVNFDTKFGELC